MALQDCQVQVRDLVMGPGTPYRVLPGFNPWDRTVRATQTGPRAWNHGTWSGAEWADEVVVPIPLMVTGQDRDLSSWLAAQQALAAAFRPIGDVTEQVELRWRMGGGEWVMFGRPRMVQPTTDLISVGKAVTRCVMVCQDPRVYSGALHEAGPTGLTQFAGGLTVPFTVPVWIGGTLTGGVMNLVNAGTTSTGMTLRIDGPVDQPRLVLQTPDGSTSALLFEVDVAGGQWLQVDTVARTALLNGLPQSNQFGRSVWGWEQHPLPPGTSTLRFFAESFDPDAAVTVQFRSAWW